MTYLQEVNVDQRVRHDIHGAGVVTKDKDDSGRVEVEFDSGATRRVTVSMLKEDSGQIEEVPVDILKPEVYNEERVDADLAYRALHELCSWKF